MSRTWNVEWSPISDKYVLMLWLNNKAYTLNITKEFAKTLGDAYTLEGLIEQGYINENTRLKSENAALLERLENVVGLPCKIGDIVYKVHDRCNGKACPYNGDYGQWRCHYEGKQRCEPFVETIQFCYENIPQIGKTIFISKEEAESRLADLKGEKK